MMKTVTSLAFAAICAAAMPLAHAQIVTEEVVTTPPKASPGDLEPTVVHAAHPIQCGRAIARSRRVPIDHCRSVRRLLPKAMPHVGQPNVGHRI